VTDRRVLALVYVGGVLFGFGLGFSQMARPEVVLSFLELHDFGLLFVMFGAAIVTGPRTSPSRVSAKPLR